MSEATSTAIRRPDVAAASGRGSAWLRRALPWAAWSFLLAPACIVLHELGHLLAARAVGFRHPALHFGGVDFGAGAGLPRAAPGLAGLAGPAMTAALALAGCAGVRWRARRSRVVPWAALAVAATSRFAVAVPYTLASAGARALGVHLATPAFDEAKAGAALGWPGDALLAGTSVLFALVLLWVGRHLARGERAAAWSGLVLGTALGCAAWMGAAGPWLLP